jgi:hypothetical protein
MKKLMVLIAIAGMATLYSCGSSEAANNMAGEMCAAMEKLTDDPASMLDAANAMMEITKKEDEYGNVTEAQLEKAMKEQCPEGWDKFQELTQ